MNKQRKTALKLELDGLRALKRSLRANPPSLEELEIALAKSKKNLEKIHDEEQDAFEKMSEKRNALLRDLSGCAALLLLGHLLKCILLFIVDLFKILFALCKCDLQLL